MGGRKRGARRIAKNLLADERFIAQCSILIEKIFSLDVLETISQKTVRVNIGAHLNSGPICNKIRGTHYNPNLGAWKDPTLHSLLTKRRNMEILHGAASY